MDSESDLDQAIKSLQIVAQAPELYPVFAEMNAVDTILGLLTHENTDISFDVVELLDELLDDELDITDKQDEVKAFTDVLVES